MSTTLQTITSNLRMRWRETYVSEGLNQKMVTIPLGIHRGFGVIPSVTDLTVTIKADATKSDHVAVYETQGTPRYSLTIHMTSDFDLSLASLAGTTVVIGIAATYSIGVDSTAEINAYTEAEFAAAGDGAIIALATVDVPGAGAIPSANIDYSSRTSAWQNVAPEAVGWYPVVKNGGFESSGSSFLTGGLIPSFWRNTNAAPFALDTSSPHSGLHALLLKTTGPGVLSGDMYQIVNVPVTEGQHVKLHLYRKILVQLVAGTATLFAEWGDVSGAVLSTTQSTLMNTSTVVDADYVSVDVAFAAPAGTATLRKIGIRLTGFGYGAATNGCLVDDFQCYVETLDVLDAPSSFDRMGDVVSSGVIIEDDAQTSFDDNAVFLSFDKSAGAYGQLNVFRRSTPGTGPILKAAAFESDSALGFDYPQLKAAFSSVATEIQPIHLAEDSDATEGGYILYQYPNGSFAFVNNATFDNGTSLWGYTSATTSAVKLQVENGKMSVYYHTGGGTWADGAWIEAESWNPATPNKNILVPALYPEITAPSVPPAANAYFFFRSNGIVGSGHRTQMCVRWPDIGGDGGKITVIAESDPTP